MRIFNSFPWNDIDPISDSCIKTLAYKAVAIKNWQEFERIIDQSIIEPRPAYREVNKQLLIEAQLDHYPTSRILPVEEAFARWTTEFSRDRLPINSFWCYVHNNRKGIFYELPRRDERDIDNWTCDRGQRFGLEGSNYQSGFGYF